jgi:hypothetical protein
MLQTNKAWSKEISMAYILNKRYEAKDMPSWLYQQIHVGASQKPKAAPLVIDNQVLEDLKELEKLVN